MLVRAVDAGPAAFSILNLCAARTIWIKFSRLFICCGGSYEINYRGSFDNIIAFYHHD